MSALGNDDGLAPSEKGAKWPEAEGPVSERRSEKQPFDPCQVDLTPPAPLAPEFGPPSTRNRESKVRSLISLPLLEAQQITADGSITNDAVDGPHSRAAVDRRSAAKVCFSSKR